MPYWDNKLTAFRIFLSLAVLTAFSFGVLNLIEVVSTVTDENYYTYPFRTCYVSESIIGERILDTEQGEFQTNPRDSIVTGSLILGINDRHIYKGFDIFAYLDSMDEKSKITLRIFELTKFKGGRDPRPWYSNFVVEKSGLNKRSLKPLDAATYVFDVKPLGASDRAGIKIGDLIVGVNYNKFHVDDDTEFKQAFDKGDKNITYQILRNNKIDNISVELALFGISFRDIIYFVTGLMFFVLTLFVGLKRANLVPARILTYALFLLAAFFSFGLIKTGLVMNPYYLPSEILRIFILTVGMAVLFQSSYYFPKETKEIIERKWIVISPYIFGGLLFSFWLITVITKIQIQSFNLLFNVLFLLPIAFYIIIRIVYRKKISKEYRKIGRMIRWAFYILLIVELLGYLLMLLNIQWDTGFLIATVLFIPFSYYYTIGRFRLLDLELRIKKNIQYGFISMFWKILVLFIFGFVIWMFSGLNFDLPNIRFSGTTIEVLETPLGANLQDIYNNMILAVFSVFSAWVFIKIFKKGQSVLDEKFYRSKFDFRKAISELSEVLENQFGINELANSMVDKLGDIIHFKQVGVIFFKNESFVCAQEYYGFNSNQFKEFTLYSGKKLIEAIKQFTGPFRVEYLPINLKDILSDCKFQYIVPITSKGKVIGAILIGEKLSESAYTSRDLEFISSIALHASTAIENALLYEDLAKQERMKHELEIARRIQLASLPQDIPDITGLDISGISLPALEVGGDFYDFLNGEEKELTIVVGDVSGKGTSAALYMSKAQGIMRTLHEFKLSPYDLFVRSNQLLYKYLEKSSFISAISVRIEIENKSMQLARAGHIPMFWYNTLTKQVTKIKPKGIVLGLTKDDLFDRNLEQISLNYTSGDIFLLVTDGVVEARNHSQDDFGSDRLEMILKNSSNSDSHTIRDNVVNAVQQFSKDKDQFDDLTVVVVKIS